MALSIIPVLNGDRELEVRTATYGPGIDQSQRAKSVSLIIMYIIHFHEYYGRREIKVNILH